ncbi:guanosine-3',5'-bis(diphosphate) 3'-pyrophosphohydrolase MESH1-like isoform X2 [Haliotis rubra]|uniref:guanosine-3',5'-bis(diphosphate) 3'-pyrophosphohydrolase MESH1-like isoform X2 n=1 Tax=Haliotis rubra TaxID=36100 RepID=UPI001EE61808|nr:guanosine-3',5'-bis(diphosphate) 3'-pyrophosphohydrolase MESH1-like isoform X2 [Haliotis rubra]XP_046544288.1 guanosine-3',5'-bis(diphosphate) 3'-pyrophosphohydrolase MESH1-like isoform X2 [Haliotis rubra]
MQTTETGSITREIIRCANFSAIKHKDQRRKDPEMTPYINHPIGVAYILTEEAGITDLSVIQTALLHDTVEDTSTTFDEIEAEFGKEVRDLVVELSDDKTLMKEDRKRLQIEHAPHASPKAKLVKLADKLYNLRDLQRTVPRGWSQQRMQGYFIWAAQVVAGLRGTNKIMEEALDKIFKERNVDV